MEDSSNNEELERIKLLNDKVEDLLNATGGRLGDDIQNFYDKQKALYDVLSVEEKMDFLHGVTMGCQYKLHKIEKILSGLTARLNEETDDMSDG